MLIHSIAHTGISGYPAVSPWNEQRQTIAAKANIRYMYRLMTFKRCEVPPTDNQLAMHNPGLGLNGYDTSLRLQHKYWAESEGSVAPDSIEGQLARAMHHEFATVSASEHPLIRAITGPRHVEQTRRRGLGALAATLIMRQVITMKNKEAEVFEDAFKEGMATILVDIMSDNAGIPLEPRIHMEHDLADRLLGASPATEQSHWYREGDLYVRRSQPADISTPLSARIQAAGITVDHENMTTLAPYMAAAPFRIAAMN